MSKRPRKQNSHRQDTPQGHGASRRKPAKPDTQRDSRRKRGSDTHKARPTPPPAPGTLAPRMPDSYFLHGRHAVAAALQNPKRECIRLVGTKKALTGFEHTSLRPDMDILVTTSETLDGAVPPESPHQGIVLEVRPLAQPALDTMTPDPHGKNVLLLLDQVTDPHNVGACLRSAAALGAKALITLDKNSPQESGVLARASSGGLEVMPWIRVTNLSQALDTLAQMGYWRIGLDGDTDQALGSVDLGENIALVLGSEGKGLRPLVRKHCDMIAKIPMTGHVESLNVSNAAAIALYEMMRLR